MMHFKCAINTGEMNGLIDHPEQNTRGSDVNYVIDA